MGKIRSSVELLTENELQLIHENALRILREIGMKTPNVEVLTRCAELGANVDFERMVVKIPTAVMEETIKKAQAESTYNEETEIRKPLSASVSTQVFFFDYQTRTRRYGLLNDVKKGICLLDQLDAFPGTSAVVLPSDVPANIADVESFHMIYSYAKKEGGTFILSPASAKYILEMTKAVGREVGYFLETVSPLQFRKESLEIALEMGKQGCGLGIGPMVVGGTLGPITIAGNCSLQTAEILGSMFVCAAINNKYSFGFSAYNHTADMRTMLCSFGSPNQALLGIAAAQMGKFYGLWSVSNSGLTDALAADFQCGMEKAATSIFSLLAGCSGTGAMGIVGADQGISLEQLVLDNEYIKYYNYILNGIVVDEDTLAFETIKDVGIGGNFVSELHTVEHIKESYFNSKIFDRVSYDVWQSAEKPTALDRAHAFVQERTKDYEEMQPVISASQYEEITRIRDEARLAIN